MSVPEDFTGKLTRHAVFEANEKEAAHHEIKNEAGDVLAIVYDRKVADLLAAAPHLLHALKIHDRFWAEMPKGQLGGIVCDIGLLNAAFIEGAEAIREAAGA